MIQFLQGRNMYPKFRRVRSYAASENAIFHKLVDVLQERIQLQDARGVAVEAQENKLQDYMGAIDGTHVPISLAPCLQDPYWNIKSTLREMSWLCAIWGMHSYAIMLIGVVRMRFQILKRTHIIRLTQSDIVLPCALQNFICNHEAVEQWIARSGLCI